VGNWEGEPEVVDGTDSASEDLGSGLLDDNAGTCRDWSVPDSAARFGSTVVVGILDPVAVVPATDFDVVGVAVVVDKMNLVAAAWLLVDSKMLWINPNL